MVANISITPTMLIGDDPSPWPEAVRVSTLREAVSAITTGGAAHIPAGRWDLAADVLREFRCSDAYIARTIHYAKTGELLPTSAV
jgi:hypothetical protein